MKVQARRPVEGWLIMAPRPPYRRDSAGRVGCVAPPAALLRRAPGAPATRETPHHSQPADPLDRGKAANWPLPGRKKTSGDACHDSAVQTEMLSAFARLRNRFRTTDPVRIRAATAGKGTEPLTQIGTQPAVLGSLAHDVPFLCRSGPPRPNGRTSFVATSSQGTRLPRVLTAEHALPL